MRRPVAPRGVLLRVGVLLLLASAVLPAASAYAENPVLDAAGDADVASSLAEALQVQGVCYGYVLQVADADTGQFSGTFATSSLGAGVDALGAPDCRRGSVVVAARIDYTSSFSEAEDSARWELVSTVGGLTMADVEAVTGGSATDLLDDSRSETALLNAVLALPGLASERAGLPPVVLEPNTEPLPDGARATDRPGSDWLRQNGALLALCAFAVAAGVVAFLSSRRPARDPSRPRTFGPVPRTPGPVPRTPGTGPYASPPGPSPPAPPRPAAPPPVGPTTDPRSAP